MIGPNWLVCVLVPTVVLAAVQNNAISANPAYKRSITPNNTCGGKKGYTCDPTAKNGGPCCSTHGYCGKTEAYCGTGCQAKYSNPGCQVPTPEKCGGASGLMCNPTNPYGGACCSSSGLCGFTAKYCGASCDPQYGQCFGTSPPATQQGGYYNVEGIGLFTTFKNYTFESFPSNQLAPSTDKINTKPLSHKFEAANVYVKDGFMQLLVPGGQTKAPIKTAEVHTIEQQILYGSVRTYAIFSDVPGTVHAADAPKIQGLFFYRSDRQEIDIEYVTDPKSESNPGNGKSDLQYTDQAVNGNPQDATSTTSPAPADAASAVHEYRIDWIPGKTMFYLDGVLQRTETTNVPTKPGGWIWNNWCDGNKGFTVGPPKKDNILLIKNIIMYYNTSSSA